MTGTFSIFNTPLSALRYSQTAMNAAGQNIANAGTEGYTRRRVDAAAAGAPVQPALWERYDGHGGGVEVTGVSRMTDGFLAARSREEHGRQSWLDVHQSVLERVESGIAEPSDNGVAAAMADFRQSLRDLANNPGQDASRSQVLARANGVVDALHIQASNLDRETDDQGVRLTAMVAEVNQVAQDLASTNHSIAAGKLTGQDVNTLLDQRDQLAQRLAELTGVTGKVNTDGGMDVTVGGVPLVAGDTAGSLSVTGGFGADGHPDGTPVTFGIADPAGTAPAQPVSGLLGEVGATADILTTVLPGYRSGLDQVAADFADAMNTAHGAGYDLNGDPGGTLFGYDPADPAGSITVAITDTDLVAASGIAPSATSPGGNLDGGNADAMADGFAATEEAYQNLVNGFGAQVASAGRLAANQRALTQQVDASREQVAGVNSDEEAVNLMLAQRTYEASSRVITTLDSVLDTLINRTGLVR